MNRNEYPEFASNRVFYDNINFPRGFNRSGDFTLKEAELLARHGAMLNDLGHGRLTPTNPAQAHLLEVVQGYAEPETELERVWLKYLMRTRKPVLRYTCATGTLENDHWVEDSSDL